MGYVDEWGDWQEDPPEQVKAALWVPKKVQPIAKPQSSIPVKHPVKHQLTLEERRLGGQKGAKTRKARLSPEKRREIAQKAARKRWGC